MLPGQKIIAIFGSVISGTSLMLLRFCRKESCCLLMKLERLCMESLIISLGLLIKHGDAFLLVWKFMEEDMIRDDVRDTIELRPNVHRVHQLADMSVIFSLKLSHLSKHLGITQI